MSGRCSLLAGGSISWLSGARKRIQGRRAGKEVKRLSEETLQLRSRLEQLSGEVRDVASDSFVGRRLDTAAGDSLAPINQTINQLFDALGEKERELADRDVWFSRFAGVDNLTDDLRPGKPELRIRLKEGALRRDRLLHRRHERARAE